MRKILGVTYKEMPTAEIIAKTDILAVYAKATELSANGIRHRQTTAGDGYMMLRCFNKEVHKRGDRNPSLTVNLKTKHYKCLAAGCVKGGLLQLVMDAVPKVRSKSDAINWIIDNDLVGQEINVASMEKVRGFTDDDYSSKVHIATHVYRNEQGAPHMRVLRYQVTLKCDGSLDKTCEQQRWTGKSWEPGIIGIRQIPYHLPEILAAAKEHQVIFWPEGENKVDALGKIGLVAGTNAGGSGVEYKPEWGPFVQGLKGIIILPDCDVPGRTAARIRQEFFRNMGVPTAIFDIAPERNDAYDIKDWLEKRKDVKPQEIVAELRGLYRGRKLELCVA